MSTDFPHLRRMHLLAWRPTGDSDPTMEESFAAPPGWPPLRMRLQSQPKPIRWDFLCGKPGEGSTSCEIFLNRFSRPCQKFESGCNNVLTNKCRCHVTTLLLGMPCPSVRAGVDRTAARPRRPRSCRPSGRSGPGRCRGR